MGEAHVTLTDPVRREKYMKLVSEGGATPEAQHKIALVVEAATAFQKAEIFMKRNDLAQAEPLARKAYEDDPMQPDYLALVAWIEAQKPQNQNAAGAQASIVMINEALDINKQCERAYFYRGMLHKRLGDTHAAVRDFRRAAEMNPRNLDAVREVRLHMMRREKGSIPPPARKDGSGPPPEKSGGIFSGLFKKK
jgi:Tfp pilus assembly protein PilF